MTREKFRPRPAIGQNIYFSLEKNTFQIEFAEFITNHFYSKNFLGANLCMYM